LATFDIQGAAVQVVDDHDGEVLDDEPAYGSAPRSS